MEPVPTVPDFTLLRRIGGGSYGDVWLGRSVTGVLRAIKIVSRARFADERPYFRELEGITRFQQAVGDEPRQLALLHVGRDDRAGVFYYVMELADDAVSGREIDPATYVPLTLKELHTRRRQLPAADCVRIGTELATALGGLHEAGLLHRDVKPSNVIFVDGRAKLADVGLIASSEATATSVGTPDYAPPEGTGSVRADLYSLGRVLYELATDLRPHEFPRLPADLPARPDAGALVELNEIVLRACDSVPAHGYRSAEEMLADLRLIQAGKSVQELKRARRQLHLLKRAGIVAGACSLAVIVVLGVRQYFAAQALATQEAGFRRSAEAAERLARYASDLHLTQLGLSKNDLGIARSTLRRQIPEAGETDLRGIEWYAFWNESEGQAIRTIGQVGGPPITALALARDGRRVAAIERGLPNRAVLLDLETGERRVIADDCYGLAGFDVDETHLIVARSDQSIVTLDLATGTFGETGGRGRFVGGLGDGRSVLLAREPPDDTVFIWDTVRAAAVDTWTPESHSPQAHLVTAAATPDRRLLAAAFFWDVGPAWNGELIVHDRRRVQDAARFQNLPVTRIRFSPDGAKAVFATESRLVVVDTADWTPGPNLPAPDGQPVFEFSPDGSQIAVGDLSRTIRIWQLAPVRQAAALSGHESAILALAWNPDGSRLVSGSLDGTCRVWPGAPVPMRQAAEGFDRRRIGSLIASADGRWLAVTDNREQVALLDPVSMETRRTFAALRPLVFTSDRALLAVAADGALVRCDVESGGTTATGVRLAGDMANTDFAVSGNRRFVASHGRDGFARIRDLLDPSHVDTLEGTPNDVQAFAVSDDGRSVAVSDDHARLSVSRVGGGAQGTSHDLPALITALAFAPAGDALAAGTEKGDLLIYRLPDAKLVARETAHSTDVRCVVFTPDRARLLSVGADGLIVSWIPGAWRAVASWPGAVAMNEASPGIDQVALDGTASLLAILTGNGTVRRWDCRRPAAARP